MINVHIKLYLQGSPKQTLSKMFKHMPFLLDKFNFIDDPVPDFVVFYNKKYIPPNTNATKIFYGQEAMPINMSICDWAFGFPYEEDIKSDHYIRLPNYVMYPGLYNIVKKDTYNIDKIIESKTEFCTFVYGHTRPERVALFNELSKYKKVTSPGSVCNNAPPIRGANAKQSRFSPTNFEDLVKYISPYKFHVAFENTLFKGYTTEKIVSAMQANAIPIYFGNPSVHRDFNTLPIINAHSFKWKNQVDLCKKLVEIVKLIDKDKNLYTKLLQQPWFNNNTINKWSDQKRIIDFFTRVFTKKQKRF